MLTLRWFREGCSLGIETVTEHSASFLPEGIPHLTK